MKLVIAMIIVALSACSYTSRDTELDLVSPPNWTVDLYGSVVNYETKCGDSNVLVGMNRLLESDGGSYFFLLAPIGNADVLDVPENGLDVFVRYPHTESICDVKDVTLDFGGKKVSPAKAETAFDRGATCSYKFEIPLSEAGQMELKFHWAESCSIPNLPIKYKTNSRHHYDSIQG